MTLSETIDVQLVELNSKGLYRKRVVNSESLLHFSSNDYLSLRQNRKVSEAYQQGFQKYPASSGGSPVVCGYHATHQSLERAFADLLVVDDCLLFTSGYAANLAVSNLLASLKAHCLIDKGLHASMYDGLQLSKVAFTRYLHNDFADFSKKIVDLDSNSVVLTESIFSMSGQQAPLQAISSACKKQGTTLIVDEAHAFGIVGKQGAGAVALADLNQDTVPLRIIPLGKACAGQGAIVAGASAWIEALIQFGRSFIYSTAISPALAYGLEKTLDILIAADDRRAKLQQLIPFFKQQIQQSSLSWTDSNTPIQQLCLGDSHQALTFGKRLYEKGISCIPMRYPTVSHKNTGLRIILNYDHQFEDISRLFNCLERIINDA